MGLKMSAVSTEVAEFWECTEREVRGKYELCLRTPQMARGRVQASALLQPRFQLIERRFRPIVLDVIPRPMQKNGYECWFARSISSDLCGVC